MRDDVTTDPDSSEHPPTSGNDWGDDEILDFTTIPLQKLRNILVREGPHYPVVKESDNPYRDGYVTDPPKKPRASYLMFQCTMRSYFQKRHPDASLTELMSIIGDRWRSLSDAERELFMQLAKEETEQFEAEKAKMEKAQKPNEVWQPFRRCHKVLDRLVLDSFADIFLEPVDLKEFTDYEDIIDIPMDLHTVRTNLENKKYFSVEQFARDMRRVSASLDASMHVSIHVTHFAFA